MVGGATDVIHALVLKPVGKLPWLDPWLNTPSNHRVHHGAKPIYLDKNYGGILIVWDRLFGSYQAEGERPVYGLTAPLRSAHPLAVHGREAARLIRDLWRSGSATAALRTAFGPPGVGDAPDATLTRV